MNDLYNLVEGFARAGGGGSGGDSDGAEFLYLVGHAPMHFISSLCRKHLPISVASMICWPIGIIYGIILIAIFRGWGVIMAAGAVIGTGAGLYNWFNKIAKMGKHAKQKQSLAAQSDAAWSEERLQAYATQAFTNYQQHWSNNDIASMQSYMTPWYHYHNQLMITALQQAGRRNIVGEPKIIAMQLVDITDQVDNAQDTFTMHVEAQADDQLIDTDNKVIFRDKKAFSEFWHFQRSGNGWLLSGISQGTESGWRKNPELEQFAAANQYCFSPDWGWLLLPLRGQLFGDANFGKSDINNHVIGVYNDMLIQLYNYIPAVSKEGKNNFIIAQATLPKSYGNIVVRKKRKLSLTGIKGLKKLSTEWREFNDRYELWASNAELATSFELLNPSYMVYLQELPIEINIEVVDNIVYLYSAKVAPSAANYQIMLTVLQKAFKEMKM